LASGLSLLVVRIEVALGAATAGVGAGLVAGLVEGAGVSVSVTGDDAAISAGLQYTDMKS